MIVVWIIAAAAAVIVVATIRSHNRFVTQRQLMANAWSNVDTELHRRHDLVPNLVATVRGYAAHERATLDGVITARQRAVDANGDAKAENSLGHGIRQLLALCEAYPDLRASDHFLELQRELTRTEDRLQASRRIFNGNVRDYNRRVESFPTMLVARTFGFSSADYFELDDRPTVAQPSPTVL